MCTHLLGHLGVPPVSPSKKSMSHGGEVYYGHLHTLWQDSIDNIAVDNKAL